MRITHVLSFLLLAFLAVGCTSTPDGRSRFIQGRDIGRWARGGSIDLSHEMQKLEAVNWALANVHGMQRAGNLQMQRTLQNYRQARIQERRAQRQGDTGAAESAYRDQDRYIDEVANFATEQRFNQLSKRELMAMRNRLWRDIRPYASTL